MAANPPCQFEGCEQPSTFTGTFFDSGLSVIVCGDHFVAFAGGTLEALTGVPVLDIIATVGAEPEVEADTPTPDDEPPSSESPESSSAPTDTDDFVTKADAEIDTVKTETCHLRHTTDGAPYCTVHGNDFSTCLLSDSDLTVPTSNQ